MVEGGSSQVYVGVLTPHPRGRLRAHLFLKGKSPLGKGWSSWLLLPKVGGGGCGPTWVLEGQATIAWVLLELNFLQGEDGGGWAREESGRGLGGVTQLLYLPSPPCFH